MLPARHLQTPECTFCPRTLATRFVSLTGRKICGTLLNVYPRPSTYRGISMLNRNVSLAVCLGVIAGLAFAQSNQGTGYIFQFASSTAATGQFQGFTYNTQSLGTPVFNSTGPSGANQVIPKPDGSKFYVVGPGGVYDFNPGFTTSASINGISGTPTQAIISPDGRYVLVASNLGAGGGTVYILNTTNDAIVLNEPVTGSVIAMVVSRDSQTAW